MISINESIARVRKRPGALRVLRVLDQLGVCRVIDWEVATGISTTPWRGHYDWLLANGLVARMVEGSAARSRHVHVSAAGRELLDALDQPSENDAR